MGATVQTLTPNATRTRFVVMQRRPLASLSWWKRWLVRRVYKIVKWQTADGEELQAVCDTEAIAKAICGAGGDNWFYHELPLNISLPAETAIYKGVRFPMSDASEFYERIAKKQAQSLIVFCPFSGDQCKPHEVISQDALRATARRLKAAAAK